SEITALFAGNDELAVGALHMACELGIKVPNEISIIGYDDIPIAKMVWPSLSTVSQPLKKMGYESTKELVKQMNQLQKKETYSYITHEIAIRDSVADLN